MAGLRIQSFTVEQIVADVGVLHRWRDPAGFLAPCSPAFAQMLADNPNGRPQDLAMLLAIHEDVVVGRLGFIGAKLVVAGRALAAHWTDGFFLLPEYRSSGAGAMLLLRGLAKCPLLAAAGGPDEAAQKLYAAAGLRQIAAMRRFVGFYSARPALQKLAGLGALAPLVKPLLPLRFRAPAAGGDVRWSVVDRAPAELDSVLPAALGAYAMHRDVATLNWVARHRHVRLALAKRGDQLIGYALLKRYRYPGGGRRGLPACEVGCLLDYALTPGVEPADALAFAYRELAGMGAELFELHTPDPKLQEAARAGRLLETEGTLAFVRPPRDLTIPTDAAWFLTHGAGDLILMKP